MVIPSSYRERHETRGHPARLVMRHAVGKARKALLPSPAKPGKGKGKGYGKQNTEGWILGADTLVYFRGRLLGKPADRAEACRMIGEMTGHIHWVYTGIALRNIQTGKEKTAFAKTKVKFKKWDKKKIKKYLAKAQPLDKAGAYAIQVCPSIVASYQGSLSNVIGLPVKLLRKMLRQIEG